MEEVERGSVWGEGEGLPRGGICNEEIGMALLLMVEGQQGCKNE